MGISRRSLLLSGLGGLVLISLSDVHQLASPAQAVLQTDRLTYPALAAHRGGRDLYPEGSMVAFREVVRNFPGAVLEMDVRPLKDGTLVVCHDATIDRIAVGQTGRVADMSPAQWRALQVHNTDGTEVGKAAFLSDVLGEFGGTDTVLMIELKDYSDTARNQYVKQLWPYRGQVISACFDARVARTLAGSGFSGQQLSGTLPEAYLPGMQHVALNHKKITESVVRNVHAEGLRLWAWTVNDATRKNALYAMGVDGVMTDNPNI